MQRGLKWWQWWWWWRWWWKHWRFIRSSHNSLVGAFPIKADIKKTNTKNIIRYLFHIQPPFTVYACPLKKDLDCKTDNTPTAHPDPKDCRRFIKCSQVSIIITVLNSYLIITTFCTTTTDTAILNLFSKSLKRSHVAISLGLTRSVKLNVEFFSEL